jgi:hypothetical protein
MVKRRYAAQLVDAALKAVEAGELSVEDVLSGGATRSPRFRAWLSHRLQRVPQRYGGPMRVRHHRLDAADVSQILEAARAKFGKHEHVLHITWGVKTVGSHTAPTDALIFIVDEKPADMARGSPAFIPKMFEVQTPSGRHEVATDVRVRAKGTKQADDARPGFHCGVNAGAKLGTLSCITSVGGVPHAIISGHVAVTPGVVVSATSVSGTVVALGSALKVKNDQSLDAALVGPVPAAGIGEVADTPTGLRDLQDTDTHLSIRIAVNRTPGSVYASVEVASEPATFVDPNTGATHAMDGVIRLDQAITVHGDSGAPAMDLTGQLVGFVEGVAGGRTYLIPARRVIDGIT